MFTQFNHIGVNVCDLRATLEFYSKHLGARFVRGLYIPSSNTIGAYVQIGSFMIEFLCPLTPSENTVYGIDHLAYLVDDLDYEARRLEELGYRVIVKPKQAGSGCGRLAFVLDPNGARVELIERAESFLEEGWEPCTDVLGADHASVFSNDLAAAMKFYTQDLEMHILHNYHFEERKFDMIYLNLGDNVLELLHNETPHTGPLMGHLAFLVRDCKKMAEDLARQGVRVLTQPRELATKNGFVFSIADPDGIQLELIDRPSLFEVKE